MMLNRVVRAISCRVARGLKISPVTNDRKTLPCRHESLSFNPDSSSLGGTRYKSVGRNNFHTTSTSVLSRSLRWMPIPLGFGFGFAAYRQYRLTREWQLASDAVTELRSCWELMAYRMMPLRTFSRMWGRLNSVELPVWAREPVLSLYARLFGCNLEEAEYDELERYSNLGEFFRRGLKPSARVIHPGDSVVSPADGIIVSCGTVLENKVEQVKGVTYSLASFFGTNVWSSNSVATGNVGYARSLLSNPVENRLYHMVVYLAPGDYHRFHSPTDWEICFRRHFAGDLLSVNPRLAQRIPGLFALNERAVYVGKWKNGFFSMTAVGATNVGSIRIYKDIELQTNCRHQKKGVECVRPFQWHQEAFSAAKGEPFGEFNLGSTIVLIFEAPRGFRFNCKPGERVQMGVAIGDWEKSKRPTNYETKLTSKNWLECSLRSILRSSV